MENTDTIKTEEISIFALAESGLSVIPIKDGLKIPAVEWVTYQKEIASKEIITEWKRHHSSWGMVCGSISGNLEVLDFDAKHKKGIFKTWVELLSAEAKKILKTLPVDTTRNKGFHVPYRCDQIEGNQKLAQVIKLDDAGKKRVETIIETRGEGGQVLIPPSSGYKTARGSLLEIPLISSEIRQEFLSCARALNEHVRTENFVTAENRPNRGDGVERPGDWFDRTATWEEILEPHGWKLEYAKGDEGFWKRPGKDGAGISATTGHKANDGNGNFLYVFSTNTVLEPEKGYTKFIAYAFLNHGGDFKKAVKEIVEKNPSVFPRSKGNYKKEGSSAGGEKSAGIYSEAILKCFSDIAPEDISWLWPGRIALGKVTLISGDPGLGKSLITTSMAAHVSKGNSWPVDGSGCPIGDVILLSAEDDAADTIRPRLDAAEADCNRIHFLEAIRDVKEDKVTERMFSLQYDLERLEETLKLLPDCRLVIIDPISAYLGDADGNSNSAMQGLLMPLGKISAKYNIALVAVSHLNKSGGGNALYRTMGSLAFVATARASYIVLKDPQNPDRCLILTAKINIAKGTGGIAYSINTAPNGAPIIAWDPEPVSLTANEALAAMGTAEEKNATDEATDFLWEELKDGARSVADIKKEAKKAGISEKTLRSAREKLGVYTRKISFEKGWEWSLPISEVVQDPTPPEQGTLGGAGHLPENERGNEGPEEPKVPSLYEDALGKRDGDLIRKEQSRDDNFSQILAYGVSWDWSRTPIAWTKVTSPAGKEEKKVREYIPQGEGGWRQFLAGQSSEKIKEILEIFMPLPKGDFGDF